jgi:hypothetical protein
MTLATTTARLQRAHHSLHHSTQINFRSQAADVPLHIQSRIAYWIKSRSQRDWTAREIESLILTELGYDIAVDERADLNEPNELNIVAINRVTRFV